VDVVATGDYQAAEKTFEASRRTLEVCPELDNAPGQRVWAYRKAAWAIEDLEQDVGLIYRQMGRKGLESIENVGPRLGEVIEGLLAELSASSGI